LLDAVIKDSDGKLGPLAIWVQQVVNGVRKDLIPVDESQLHNQLKTAASKRISEVLSVWFNADYGNDLLKKWAAARTPVDQDLICTKVADVGVSYVKLVLEWDQYVNAIQNLGPLEAYWLFTRVRD
jgi:hypothetical protein